MFTLCSRNVCVCVCVFTMNELSMAYHVVHCNSNAPHARVAMKVGRSACALYRCYFLRCYFITNLSLRRASRPAYKIMDNGTSNRLSRLWRIGRELRAEGLDFVGNSKSGKLQDHRRTASLIAFIGSISNHINFRNLRIRLDN